MSNSRLDGLGATEFHAVASESHEGGFQRRLAQDELVQHNTFARGHLADGRASDADDSK
jgi:hypothetical protein